MVATKKVRLIISLAVILIIALFAIVVVQVFNITKAKREISRQQDEIYQLEKQLDSFTKLPDSDYEVVS